MNGGGDGDNAGEETGAASTTGTDPTDTDTSGSESSDDTTESSTGAEDTGDGGAVFLGDMDAPCGDPMCDGWAQDCAYDEKCAPFPGTPGSDAYDAEQCVPAGDGPPGAPCMQVIDDPRPAPWVLKTPATGEACACS